MLIKVLGRALAIGPERTVFDLEDDGLNELGPMAEVIESGVFGAGLGALATLRKNLNAARKKS